MKLKLFKTFSVFMTAIVILTSIPFVAAGERKEEHIFSYEELACMEYTTAEYNSYSAKEVLTPVNRVEGQTKDTTTAYYIIECADGYMLTNPTGSSFSRTRYSSGSLQYKKWNFTQDSSGNYIVYSYSNPTKCLTVNPSTKTVSLSTYDSSSNYQKWKMYYSSNGNALKCVSSDSSVNGYTLVINDTSLSVSNSTFTPVGFFAVDWYVPVTSLSCPSFYLAPEQSKDVSLNKTPSDATSSNKWTIWSSVNTAVFTVDAVGKTTGISTGTATLRFTDKITRKSNTCVVTVTEIANGTYFLKNKQNSNYAKVKNETMTNGQNVVQYALDGTLSERWIFTLNTTTGYYSIKSANSSSPRYYMAVSDDSSALEKPIVIRSATESTLTDGMQWKVEKTSSGAYKIIPKTGEATDYVLTAGSLFGINNLNLVQSDYVLNNSYMDEWFCIRMLPTNGYELAYNAVTWSGLPSNNNNCYAYALNNQVKEPTGNEIWFKQQPGAYYNNHRGSSPKIPEGYQNPPSVIVNSVQSDFNKYNAINGTSLTFTPIGRYDVCPTGTYKVALVVSNLDYHWYRQDSDGLWSHKRGTTPVKRTDESGELIIDPMLADRASYTTFVGYYAVKPWNNLYTASKASEAITGVVSSNSSKAIDDNLLAEVTVGMSYETVVALLGNEGIDIGSGAIIQQYKSISDILYTFKYFSTEGYFVVSDIVIGGN